MKDAIKITIEAPDKMGKMISCLLAFKTLKLFIDIFQPLESREPVLIIKVLVDCDS